MSILGSENECVGLDIGSHSIKAIELKSKKKASSEIFKVKKIGYALLPRNAIVEGTIVDPGAVVQAIKNVFKESQISNKNTVISISGNSVIIKKISLPYMEMEELAESIIWEAKHNIPYPFEDSSLDYAIMPRASHLEDKNLGILLVAAKKDKIANYSNVIYQAGKKPEAIEVDAFALQNTLELNYPEIFREKTIAIINLGANITNVVIIEKGIPQLFRDLTFGGSLIMESLSKDLNISFDNAEKIIKGIPVKELELEKHRPLLSTSIENILREIEKTFSYYEAGEKEEGKIDLILLSGGFARLKDLSNHFETWLQIKTEILNPFRRVEFDEKKFGFLYFEEMAAHYGVAVGLATRKRRK